MMRPTDLCHVYVKERGEGRGRVWGLGWVGGKQEGRIDWEFFLLAGPSCIACEFKVL